MWQWEVERTLQLEPGKQQHLYQASYPLLDPFGLWPPASLTIELSLQIRK